MKESEATNQRGPYKKLLPNGNVKFTRAINLITGKRDKGNALPAFKRFYRERVKFCYPPPEFDITAEQVEDLVDKLIELWSSRGVPLQEIQKYRRLYSSSPRRRPRKSAKP